MLWMRNKGVRFVPIYGRQAFKIDGKFKFWGGLTVEAWGGGPGLVEAHKLARKITVAIAYGARALSLLHDDDGVQGVKVKHEGKTVESKPRRRAGRRRFRIQRRNAHALSRPGLGTRQGARHALQHRRRHPDGARHRRRAERQLVRLSRGGLGPQRAGIRRSRGRRQFPEALLSLGHHAQCQRRALRRRGRRFPQLHLCQIWPRDPEAARQFAWQIFDSKIIPLLRDEYRIKRVTKVRADTLEELVKNSTTSMPQGAGDDQEPTTRRSGPTFRSIRTSRTAVAPRASRSRSPTGPTPSTSRRSKPTP